VHSEYKGLKTIASGGHHAGYRAEFIMYPEQGTAIIVFSNVSNANVSNGNPEGLLCQVADIVLANYIVEPEQQARQQMRRERRQIPELPALTEEQLREYEGTYYSEELDAFHTIIFKDTTLVLQIKKLGDFPIRIREIDSFYLSSHTINFIRDEENRVIGFTITTPTVRNVRFDKKNKHNKSRTQRIEN